jgi:hypothetical protein
MAIKGKGRTKRRRVSAPPKPVYVKPKKPLLARRGVQIGALVVIAVAAITSVVVALLIKHHHNQRQALDRTETGIVRRFGAAFDNDLSGIGQPFQTTFTPFPSFTTDVSDFKSGKLSATQAARKAKAYASEARDAAITIQQISGARIIQGHADLLTLIDTQTMVGDALQIFEQAANSFTLATRATGAQRDSLLAHTESLLGVASHIFSDGYQKLINERNRFGLLAPTNQIGSSPPPVQTTPPVPSASPGGGSGKGSAGKHAGRKHTKK